MKQSAQSATMVFTLLTAVACTNEPVIVNRPPPADLGAALPVQATEHTDLIVQIVPPIVDVLWVVDNSCSMADEQTALTENFPKFMGYFVDSGLDYHVGVISTDLDDSDHTGKLRSYLPKGEKVPLRYIDEDTADPVTVFNALATVGTEGSGQEKGTGAVYTAIELLRLRASNIGFYRQEASLHTVLISDEDDDTPNEVITPNEFVAWYKALKSGGWRRTFSSIVSPANPNGGGFDGTDYLELTAAIGGIPWNINTEVWDLVLDRLGVEASGLRREFFLSQRPVPGAIQVAITKEVDGVIATQAFEEAQYNLDGTIKKGDWTYDPTRNSIRFVDLTPDPLDRVEITYTLLASTIGGEG